MDRMNTLVMSMRPCGKPSPVSKQSPRYTITPHNLRVRAISAASSCFAIRDGMELGELSGRTTGRLGYIGPTWLRGYVGSTTCRTTGRATSCTMDHAIDRAVQRCSQDQQLHCATALLDRQTYNTGYLHNMEI